MKANNLIGQRFGKLTVIGRAENSNTGKTRWLCKCDCGNMKKNSVDSHSLKTGKVKSCGCLYRESNKKNARIHGLTKSRLHLIWSGMKARCNNPKANGYMQYGGKGVTVCDEWTHDFKTFYDWATANGYADNLTIDRIDVNGNYEPSNCRWVSWKVQENNRSNNRIVEYCGASYTVAELSGLLSIDYSVLLYRLNNGWKEHELKIPPNLNNKNIRRAI